MRKKKIYVVGYDKDSRGIFGENLVQNLTHIYGLTASKAKKSTSKLPSSSCKVVIYRLVPVDPKEI